MREYCKLKEEPLDHIPWRTHFWRCFGPVVRHWGLCNSLKVTKRSECQCLYIIFRDILCNHVHVVWSPAHQFPVATISGAAPHERPALTASSKQTHTTLIHTHYTRPHFITFKGKKKLVLGLSRPYLDLILKRSGFFPILIFSLFREIAKSDC
jgi:hypothetical protein